MGHVEELLQLCQDLQSCADEDVLGLMERTHAPLVEQLRTVQQGDDQLSRAMVAASQQLRELGGSLSQQWQAAESATARRPHLALRLTAACTVAHHLTVLLQVPGLNTAAQEAPLRCVALLLESSRLMLADAARAGGAAACAELVQRCDTLRWEAIELLRVLLQTADMCGAAGKLAALAPPGPTISFLSAAVALGSEASISAFRATILSTACHELLEHQAFDRHAELIKADADLPQRLVGMLAPFLARAGTVLSLPPERRPPDCEEGAMWDTVSCVASVLASVSLNSGLHLHLAPQQHPAAGFSSNARRLLAASCQLLAAATHQVQPDMQIGPQQLAELLFNLTRLVATTAGFMCDQVTQHRASWPWGSTPHRLQPARLLAQMLARLPAVLPAAVTALQHESVVFSANLTAADVVADMYKAPGRAAALLEHLLTGDGARQAQLLSDAADIPAWCAAASGALRAVPLAAALQQQHRSETAVKALAAMAQQLFSAAQQMVMACTLFLQRRALARWDPAASAAASEPAGTALAAAETAFWQLHTAACRVAHCTDALGALLPQSPQLIQLLWLTAGYACNAASGLEDWAVGRVTGDIKQHLRAMATAHAPALQALCDLAGSAAGLQASELGLLIQGLAQCAELGVPAMATHADTTRLLSEAATYLDATRRAGARAGVPIEPLQLGVWDAIECALRSLRLAAVLLDCGVVDWALRDPAGRLATLSVEDVSEQENFSARAANLLTALLQAGEWEAVTGGAAGVAGAAASGLARDLDQLGDALAASEAAGSGRLALLQRRALPPATRLASALLEHWRRPEQWQRDTLAMAQAAAARSCAYLRCANVAQEGGPAAGQGDGSAKCSACRAVWYCSEACSHADWRGPGSGQHKRCCKALKAARDASRGAPAAQ